MLSTPITWTSAVLELVTWRDAHFSINDDFDEDDYLMQTPGWTSIDGRFLKIEGERQPDGSARAVTRVPLENVVRRQVLIPRTD
jgi:hypothetical protein